MEPGSPDSFHSSNGGSDQEDERKRIKKLRWKIWWDKNRDRYNKKRRDMAAKERESRKRQRLETEVQQLMENSQRANKTNSKKSDLPISPMNSSVVVDSDYVSVPAFLPLPSMRPLQLYKQAEPVKPKATSPSTPTGEDGSKLLSLSGGAMLHNPVSAVKPKNLTPFVLPEMLKESFRQPPPGQNFASACLFPSFMQSHIFQPSLLSTSNPFLQSMPQLWTTTPQLVHERRRSIVTQVHFPSPIQQDSSQVCFRPTVAGVFSHHHHHQQQQHAKSV